MSKNKPFSVLFVGLSPLSVIASTRIRAYEFVKKASLFPETADIEFKIVLKPALLSFGFKDGICYFCGMIKYLFVLCVAVTHNYTVVQTFQVFFFKWFSGFVKNRSCLIIDATDLGMLEDEYLSSLHNGVHARINAYIQRGQRTRLLGMCQYSNMLIANAGKVIPDFIKSSNICVSTLMDPVDTKSHIPVSQECDTVVIGWIGSPRTAYFLHEIEKPLIRLKTFYGDKVRIVFYGATSECFTPKLCAIADCIPWSSETECSILGLFNIGLVPAKNDCIARAKQPYKVLQHLACGTPVVAKKIGMVPYMVCNGKTGFFAESGSDWFMYLKKLIEDVALRQTMGKNARQVAEQKFDYSQYACRWRMLIDEACNITITEGH